ncbi:MAG: tetratricopeptide repeat protein [Planctomycetes bacterium]|nr:tetratricopeptide repeat protein [Planctomycetota bacterium]
MPASFRTKSILCVTIVLLTLLAYWRVGWCDFVPFDDPTYVQENTWVQQGLTAENVRWAFTTDYFANWHPLTWLSYMADRELFNLRPGPMHLMNLLIHIINAVLLFLVLERMTSACWSSVVVALLFALHPLHVESVAWISERKDVLSTLFWILTMAAYVGYVRAPSVWRYALTAVLLLMGLMSKAMLVTMPAVLLLLDIWPLARFPLPGDGPGAWWRQAARLALEKVPLLGVVALSAVLTMLAQSNDGAVGDLETYSPLLRVTNAVLSCGMYLWNTIWPRGLAVFYPHPGLTPPDWSPAPGFYGHAALAATALVVISVAVLILARRHRYLLVGWLWYLGTLVPVIGLVQVGTQGRADRYTYVPLIGIFIMIAWSVPELLRHARFKQFYLDFAALAATAACLALTWQQVSYWRNGVTLFTHVVEVTEMNGRGHGMLAMAHARAGELEAAVPHFEQALKFDPNNPRTYNHFGAVLMTLGKDERAMACYRAALELNPKLPSTHYNLGNMYSKLDRLDEAVTEFRQAIELEPTMVKAHNNLGIALQRQEKFTEASEEFRTALRLNPQHEGARQNLRLLASRGVQPATPAATNRSANN